MSSGPSPGLTIKNETRETLSNSPATDDRWDPGKGTAMTTMLGIWAHPDDEVFVSGGLLAASARRGDRVACIHMTDGEAGLSYGRPSAPTALASIRRQEMANSLARLGVEEQRSFGYPDGRLPQIPGDEVTARIHDALVELRPNEIVTFGSDGFTGHPDHKVLSAWVKTATELWDQPGARLSEVVMSTGWKESFVPALNEFDAFWPGHPTAFNDPDVTLQLDAELLDAKVEALRAHASQMKHLFDAYGDDFMRALASREHFRVSERVGGRYASASMSLV
jgi:LmbE family N-acetylglucosaminyl deacetylase